MKADLVTKVIYVTLFVFVCALLVSTQDTIECQKCDKAASLSECTTVTCNKTLEECFTDEAVTDQLTIVYYAGCRSSDVCQQGGRKRGAESCIGCSRCCNFEDFCNRQLCGLSRAIRCYSCDRRTPDQSGLSDPASCVKAKPCYYDEACYASQTDISGQDTFFYGCVSKSNCQELMQNAYNDYKLCVENKTQIFPGMTREQACVRKGQYSDSMCRACCADDLCNHGSCESILERIFALAQLGKFNMSTLTTVKSRRTTRNCLR